MPENHIELHCHSCFSFREGASTPLELVLQARRLGYPVLALTDHDGLAGAMEFAQAAKEWNVRPAWRDNRGDPQVAAEFAYAVRKGYCKVADEAIHTRPN